MALLKTSQLADLIKGLQVGLVTDNKDSEGIYRVQVQFVKPSGEIKSAWARVVTLMGGPEMGFACLPEVDDEVLLRFVNGQPDHPVVVGSVWNGKDKVPFDNSDGNNDERIWYSRSDHHVIFNDKDGSEFIQCETKGGKTNIEMMSKDKAINFSATKDFVLKIGNKLMVEAGSDIQVEASAGYTHQAGSNLELKADSGIDIKGSAGVTVKSAAVSFKA